MFNLLHRTSQLWQPEKIKEEPNKGNELNIEVID
jgi:hypothetical protein